MDDGLIQNGFDEFLADVEAHGLLTLSERRKVNHAGAKVYENHMKAFLDFFQNRGGEDIWTIKRDRSSVWNMEDEL